MALEWFHKALVILDIKLGNQHANTIVVRENIKYTLEKYNSTLSESQKWIEEGT